MQHTAFLHPGRTVEALDVQPGAIVADFGVGSGHYAHELAKKVGKEGRVYAIDVHADLLRRVANDARRHEHSQLEIIVGDVSRHLGSKLPTGSVDLVLMSNILFQLEHKQGAFAEAHRVLRPGGKLVVIDWSETRDKGRTFGPSREHVYQKAAALRDARQAQFDHVAEFLPGSHHWGMVFEAI